MRATDFVYLPAPNLHWPHWWALAMKHCIPLFILCALSWVPTYASSGVVTGPPARPAASASRNSELPTELRTAWLGSPLKRFRHLVPERRALPSHISYYTQSGESLTIGGYRVTGISYGFYKDQLCCIELRVLGQANCQGLYSLMARAYGPSRALTSSSQQWVNPQVSLLYTEMPKGYATVVLSSTTLVAQYRADFLVPINTAV